MSKAKSPVRYSAPPSTQGHWVGAAPKQALAAATQVAFVGWLRHRLLRSRQASPSLPAMLVGARTSRAVHWPPVLLPAPLPAAGGASGWASQYKGAAGACSALRGPSTKLPEPPQHAR